MQYFQQMIPIIDRQMRCEAVFGFTEHLVFDTCPDIVSALGGLAKGFLLAAIGHTLTAFLLCACWRKLVKQSKKSKVAPGDAPLGVAVKAEKADAEPPVAEL